MARSNEVGRKPPLEVRTDGDTSSGQKGAVVHFTRESEMTAPARLWLAEQGMSVREQFAMPWGICDLVGCAANPEHVRRRLTQKQFSAIGNKIRVLLYSMIPDETRQRGISQDALHRRIGTEYLSADDLERHVRELIRRRFVTLTGAGGLKSLNGWKPLHRRLVAVELKLRRVSDVVAQARNNLRFADQSFIGLPMALARRVVGRSDVKEIGISGVGILGIEPNRCEVLLDSKGSASRRDVALQTLAVERFWSVFRKDSTSSDVPPPDLADEPAALS